MAIRRSQSKLFGFGGRGAGAATKKRLSTTRNRKVEPLEDRVLMAVVGIQTNNDDLLNLTPGARNVSHEAPRDLTVIFAENDTLPADVSNLVNVTRAGFDNTLGNTNDVTIQPGFIGVGDTPNSVVFRFAETLPDDLYQVQVVGGPQPTTLSVNFDLNLGAQIISVVPQPISRDAITGALSQATDKIDVYFNNDDLFATPIDSDAFPANSPDLPTVIDPRFYQLIFTNNTATNLDNGPTHLPEFISYDPALDKATLTFSDPINELTTGPGTYRLRVGTDEVAPQAPANVDVLTDPGSSFDTARNLGGQFDTSPVIRITSDGSGIVEGSTITVTDDTNVAREFEFSADPVLTDSSNIRVAYTTGATANTIAQSLATAINNSSLTTSAVRSGDRVLLNRDRNVLLSDEARGVFIEQSQSLVLNSEIRSTDFELDFPGAISEPGHREISPVSHFSADPYTPAYPSDFADQNAGTQVFAYNFQDIYGVDPTGGGPLRNLITEAQKNRVREVFESYSTYFGLDFVETAQTGVTVATGDLRAVNPLVDTGRGGTLSISGGNLIVLDAAERFDDSFGLTDEPGRESYYREFMHELGRFLGIGPTDELPQITVSTTTPETYPTFGIDPEGVFPGDHDIVHGQHLFRPDSTDIDLYRFSLEETGLFTAETTAERLSDANPNDSSLLDSYLTLYRESPDGGRELIAQNDDYFSEDSLIELNLAPGTYYVGVSSTGNESYDPTIPDSGIGGTSQGPYQLRMNFRPQADNAILDTDVRFIGSAQLADPQALDGDADGIAGGVFNYWFRAVDPSDTLIVDSSAGPGGNGSLASPYNELDVAFQNSSFGDVVRVVGNGGEDGDPETLDDNQAVVIGVNPVTGLPLKDGTSVKVPKNVSLMVDEGAIFKMRRSSVNVGSSAPQVDRADGSLQVLGTPNTPVYFTSYDDDSIGEDTNEIVEQTPMAGNWGGLVFRNDLDRSENRANFIDYELNGIFLNHVNHADIRYGGGNVSVDSVERIFNSIDMTNARPTVSFNTITLSNFAAIAANPDSFLESNFNDPRTQSLNGAYTADYSRIGPDIHNNRLVAERLDEDGLLVTHQNTLNGLFIRIPTDAGRPLEQLTVTGRFDDTDIAHIIPENLEIASTPGGPIGISRIVPPNTPLVDRLQLTARTDAQLKIDAGIVVKLDGSRIEVQQGAQLIAEARDGQEVIFTSLLDTRYGGSGTFDTSSNSDPDGDGVIDNPPEVGDWGGIYAAPLASVSLDHALVAFGGGTTAIPGGFASFNAVEIHQAEARIANSVFEFNGDGTRDLNDSDDIERAGRASNADAVIFVRGAQPIIVNNTIRDSISIGGDEDQEVPVPAISINANALNKNLVSDPGRMSGLLNVDGPIGNEIDSIGTGNFGPFIRGNVLENNELNALEVREAVLTTESVWDDTDIVHVLQGEIRIPDFHTFGGLRLESSAAESLVVKLDGDEAGFTTFGRPLDIDDRIGGMLHVIGQPGHPVILTALADDTVGAGLLSNGDLQTDTNNDDNTTVPAPGDWRGLLLDQYTHDRNVETVTERESVNAGAPGFNATPDNAQFLGFLAEREYASDETLRLGYTIHGTLSEPQDLDVYSFTGRPGTEVWLDIDRTTHSLDTVVELINSEGEVLARSDDSYREALQQESIFTAQNTQAGLLQKSVFNPTDHWSTNPNDAGMRVVLPGELDGPELTYHVRVRSSGDDLGGELLGGETSGVYQLQIRLREIDEFGGATVQFADINYAVNGIEVIGGPTHSPLLGEASESNFINNTRGQAQDIGNVLDTDRGSISVAGNLTTGADVDWFEFEVAYQDPNLFGTFPSFVFDLDYADGLARANTIISIYDATGELVFTSRDSNVGNDRSAPLSTGGDLTDLDRGSVGANDPLVGAIHLPDGNYFVAVSSNAQIPVDLEQFFLRTPNNPLLRAEPVDSLVRIAEDHIGFSGGSTGFDPIVPNLFQFEYSLQVRNAEDIVDGETIYIVGTGINFIEAGNGVLFEFDDDGVINDPNAEVISLVDFFGEPLDAEDLAQEISFSINVALGDPAATVPFNVFANVSFTDPTLVELSNATWIEQEEAPTSDYVGLEIIEPSTRPFTLQDVTLFVSSSADRTRLSTVDPFSGGVETVAGEFGTTVGDIAMRHDGGLYAYSISDQGNTAPNSAASGNFLKINPGNATIQNIRDDDIQTFEPDMNGQPVISNNVNNNRIGDGIQFNATTFANIFGPGHPILYAVGDRGLRIPGADYYENILYALDGSEFDGNGRAPGTGLADDNMGRLGRAATDVIDIGHIDTNLDAGGGTNSVILSREVTQVGSNQGQIVTTPIIRDKDGFMLQFTDGGTMTPLFDVEFDTGPDAELNFDPGNPGLPDAVFDGEFFTLTDGAGNVERFEFDTGPVLIVGNFQPGDANSPDAGDQIRITDNTGQTRTFVIDDVQDTITPPANQIPIQIDSRAVLGTTAQQFQTALLNAINGSPLNVSAVATGNGRITITGDTNVTLVGNPTFEALTTSGAAGIMNANDTRIPVEENMTPAEVRTQIDRVINGVLGSTTFPGVTNVTVGIDGERLNFQVTDAAGMLNPPVTGDFSNVPSMNAVADTNGGAATGGTAAGAVGIEVLADNDEAEVATSIADAINNLPLTQRRFDLDGDGTYDIQVIAVNNGDSVTFDFQANPFGTPPSANGAVEVLNPVGSPFTTGAPAPGGTVTGLAEVGGVLYAISDNGGLFSIADPNTTVPVVNGDALIQADFVNTAVDLVGLNFSSLTAGPPTVEGGKYADLLFGITTGGRLYAFNTQGELQPIFAGGATSISTGVGGAHGLAFSTLDYNLWDTTGARGTDPGHGLNAAPDGSRIPSPGGTSLRFGNGLDVYAPDNVAGQETTNNYQFPGGAHGTIVSNEFSLAGYTGLDQPTLYFNYFLDTEDAASNGFNAPTIHMRDSFRVFISTTADDNDNGDWHLIGTNNTFRGPFANDDEYDWSTITGLPIQELFDNTGNWRQARIDLSGYAGNDDIRLRFDFATAGGLDMGGAQVGTELNARAGNQLRDGQTVEIRQQDLFGFTDTTFEFDLGYTLVPPSGGEIEDGETFQITDIDGIPQVFEFDKDNFFSRNIVAVDGSQIADGDSFVISNGALDQTFEFESGYSLQVETDPANFGLVALADGDLITIDDGQGSQIDFEFDTNGMVEPGATRVSIAGDNQIRVPIFGGGNNGVQDGDTFTISDGQGTTLGTFEFNSVGGVNDLKNIAVDITQTSTQNTVANAVVNAINSAGLNLFATNQGAGNVNVSGVSHVIDIGDTPALALTGSLTTPDVVADRLRFAIESADLDPDLTPTNVGNGLVNVGGTTHVITANNASGITVIGEPGTTDPEAIAISFLNSDTETDAEIAQLIANAIDNATSLGVTATANGNLVELSGLLNETEFSPGDTQLTPELVIPARITNASSAGNIAELMALLIEQSPLDVQARVDGNRVNLTGAVNAQQSFDTSLNRPGLFIDGSPGVAADHVAIPIHSDMSATEVAKQIARVFNETLNPAADLAGYQITPNTDTRIQLLNAEVLDPGPIGADSLLEGDFTPPLLVPFEVQAFSDSGPSLRGLDNDHEGPFVDDIIIGFAERGEMFTGGNVSPGYRANPASSDADIVRGEYQLEIRRASEYGIPTLVPPLSLFRSFDTNDRLGSDTTLFAPSGDQVSPGSTVRINDVTFEYVDSTIREPSDILGNAQHTGITPDGQQRFLGFGRIGDNNGPAGDNNNPAQGLDVDLLQLDLAAGDAVQLDVDALIDGDDVNTYLRIFDDAGVELANSAVNRDAADEITTFDPFLLFFAPTAGTYYVGVSGVDTSFFRLPNDDYNPTVPGSGTNAATTNGTYQLEIVVNDVDEAFPGNVPVRYATFDNAATVANRLTAAINSELVQDDLTLGVTADSNLTSDRVNLHGDVVVVDDVIDSIPVEVLETNDILENATDTGIVPGTISRYHGAGVIGDNPDFQNEPFSIALDVDLFEVELAAGDIVNVDIDARELGSFARDLETGMLDTLLRVFQLDDTGAPVEIAAVDDAGAPGEYPFGYGFSPIKLHPFLDSYFNFIAPTDGTYYFGVSSFDNVFYDPQIAGSGQGTTSGPYEITIEVGGATANGITQQVFEEQGDDNLFRPQGQLILNGNQISDSSNFGIFIDAGPRDPNTNLPHPAPVRNFVEINDQRLTPGVVVVNNVIHGNTGGGIHYSGDPNPANQPLASVPFGRIVNNTIYGIGTGDVGIEIQDNASPTILNNIVANLGTGISVDASSSTTLIGATLYQDNGMDSNVDIGEFAIQLATGDPLFVDAPNENFYLEERSRAIDSARNSLEDRPALETVRDPIGIALSPVLAPDRDALGQTRVDDPFFEPPDGFGSDVFKDRGAIERADFTGPRAILNEPRDNDAEGFDQNPQANIVETSGQAITVFSIEFEDGVGPIDPSEGSGIDPTTVTAAAISIMFTPPNSTATTTLTQGVDYTFSFDEVNDTLNITPVAGQFIPGTYIIQLDNTRLDGPFPDMVPPITDMADNELQANQLDGTVRFQIAVADDLDFGDLPENYTISTPAGPATVNYATTLADNGPRHHIRPNFFLGSRVDAELDGRPSDNAQGDDGLNSARDDEDGVRLRTILTAGGTPTIAVSASSPGLLDAWFDFNRDGDFIDPSEQIFVSRQLNTGTNVLEFTLPTNVEVGEIFSRFRFSSQGGLAPTGEALDGEVEDYRFNISPPGFQNPSNRFDVDNKGTVTTFDALLIVTALRNNDSQGIELPNPPAPPLAPPPFLDVNGDNRVTISDALDVIRELIRQQDAAGEGEASTIVSASAASKAAEPLNLDLGGSLDTTEVKADEGLTDQVTMQIGDDSLISELTLASRRQSVDNAFSIADDEEDENESLVDLAIDDIASDLAAAIEF